MVPCQPRLLGSLSCPGALRLQGPSSPGLGFLFTCPLFPLLSHSLLHTCVHTVSSYFPVKWQT